jgi:P-type Ca2+ transporter type 2C
LLVAASRFGFKKTALEQALPRVLEVPFTSERKRMTTVHRLPADRSLLPVDVRDAVAGRPFPYIAFTKGSVEALLDVCSTVWVRGKIEPLHPGWRDHLLAAHDGPASRGMRILGVAFRGLESPPFDLGEARIEQDLTFVGMIGLLDPARPEAASAVATCKKAGIRPVMITGDHPLTARTIAEQLGIDSDVPVLTGTQLDRMTSAELDPLVESTPVYARVSPEHKLKIVESLQHRGHIVAMTGDGVNDAPTLKKADIGIAMGLTGTDVAKEAADMVLLDDNFATIVAAVKEGRVIYDNIRKFIKYILATNSGEICLMLVAPFFGMPLPLLPLQILWMNLVTDGLPALALTVEPPESDLMRRPPRDPRESIFARGMGSHIIWVGLLMGFLSLAIGYGYWRANDPRWQTILFTTLTLAQMAHVMAIRSERLSLFRIGVLSNKPLLGAVTLTVLLQLALVYVPFLQGVFNTTALPAGDLALCVALPAVVFLAVEFEKGLARRQPEPL